MGNYVVKEILNKSQALKSSFVYAISYKISYKSLTFFCLFLKVKEEEGKMATMEEVPKTSGRKHN